MFVLLPTVNKATVMFPSPGGNLRRDIPTLRKKSWNIPWNALYDLSRTSSPNCAELRPPKLLFHISFGVCPVMNAVYSRRGPINLLTPRYFFSTIFCGPNPSRTRCFRGICCRNRGHIFMRKQSKNSTHFHMLSPLGSSTWILGQLGHPARFHSTRNEKKIDIFIAFSGWNYKFIVTSCNRVQFLAWNLSPWE